LIAIPAMLMVLPVVRVSPIEGSSLRDVARNEVEAFVATKISTIMNRPQAVPGDQHTLFHQSAMLNATAAHHVHERFRVEHSMDVASTPSP
jgi:hypothetical protein